MLLSLLSSSLHSLLPRISAARVSPAAVKLVRQQMHRLKVKKTSAERSWSALQAAYTAEAAGTTAGEEVAAAAPLRAAKPKVTSRGSDAAAKPRAAAPAAPLIAAGPGGPLGVQKRSRLQAGFPEQGPNAVREKSTLAPKRHKVFTEEGEEVPEVAPPAPKPSSAQVSDVRFSDLDVSPLTKKAMSEVFGYEFCSLVQAQTIPPLLTGADVVAKAKTGSGKTLAFMIPAVQALINKPQARGQVGVLVLSPTRELAMQIVAETEKLVQFQNMSVQAAIGGTNLNTAIRKLEARVPDVLVATPGRCLDLMQNSSLGAMIKTLRILILDEADNIMDMGFRPTLEKIIAMLPAKGSRQTMMFSATFPSDVKALAAYAFRPAYKIIDTVGEENNTNVQVEQYQCVVPHHHVMLQLSAILKQHIAAEPDHKVIVFFPTARQTQLYAEVFQHMQVGSVLEIHSRKSQAQRTRVSDSFRAASKVSMFSSDVSARGVDYPGVTLVVQVGLPTDKAQYVHRVGRTARAGKAGESVLLLGEFEQDFLRVLGDLPVAHLPPRESHEHDMPLMTRALAKVPLETKEKAYQAWLGFYKTGLKRVQPVQVVALANEFSRILGCKQPPELEAKTVGKMGLKGVAGLRVAGKAQRY